MNTNILIKHIEKHLGKISSSWMVKDYDEHIQVVKFSNAPIKSVSTFITLGLSHHLLAMPSGKECRQEILFSVYDNFNSEDIASMLILLSKHIISSHKAVLRGSVENIGKSIIPNVELNYLFATIPFIFPESFDSLSSINPPIMFPLLIPLYNTEARFIAKNGRQNFEKILDDKKMDLFDLKRSPIV